MTAMPRTADLEDHSMGTTRASASGLVALFLVLADRKDKQLPVASTVELSQILGISKQALSQWVRIPAEHVIEIERLTGLPRHVQRPDVYPDPSLPAIVPPAHLLSESDIHDLKDRVRRKLRARNRARAKSAKKPSSRRRSAAK